MERGHVHKVGEAAYGIDDAQFIYEKDAVECLPEEYAELENVLKGNPKKNVVVFGKTHHPKTGKPYTRPRHEAVYGRDYTYSGVTLTAETTPNTLVERVMAHANATTKKPFTWALVNLYVDGQDNVAMHQDNEKDVGGDEVRTYSFGAERFFVFREKRRKRKRGEEKPMRAVFALAHGSCGIMRGSAAQTKWEHGIPVRKRVKTSRISITPRR